LFCKYILLFQSFCTDSLYIWLRKNRNKQKVYTFLKRLFKHFGEPKFLVTDKTPSIVCAFRKLQNNVFYHQTEHRTVKYLTNLIEQDHRPIKRGNKFYQSLRTASTKIMGMETVRGLYKKRRDSFWIFRLYRNQSTLEIPT
ncbi:TPA: IS6 family transposase, partial [Enterococcus faecalis]|nr:IS6 family transposase [Enterococcus faecalis]